MKNIDIWVDRAFQYANANICEDDDIIYKAIFRYKALKCLPDFEIENIYNYLSERLGF